MRTLSIINLKGGVAKTISAVNMAYILAAVHGYKVLLIDNDKQGNASKMLDRHSYDKPSIAELMTNRGVKTAEIIQKTDYEGLDIITANMTLLRANREVMFDLERQQQTRIKKALEQVQDSYDYCIIDNAPDINISTINSLIASDDVAIPITIDEFALDGLDELTEQIEITKADYNTGLRLCGCFITQYDRASETDEQIEAYLRECRKYPMFQAHIRRTHKMKPSTFERKPILLYSERCAASYDYKALVQEYMEKQPGAEG